MENEKRIEELLEGLDHIQRVLYLAACCEHVLGQAERPDPGVDEALKGIRMWACGFMKPSQVRPLAFAAHRAALRAESQGGANAARSTAHAASAVSSLSHIPISLEYARKAAADPSRELSWQLETLKQRGSRA